MYNVGVSHLPVHLTRIVDSFHHVLMLKFLSKHFPKVKIFNPFFCRSSFGKLKGLKLIIFELFKLRLCHILISNIIKVKIKLIINGVLGCVILSSFEEWTLNQHCFNNKLILITEIVWFVDGPSSLLFDSDSMFGHCVQHGVNQICAELLDHKWKSRSLWQFLVFYHLLFGFKSKPWSHFDNNHVVVNWFSESEEC